MRGCTIDLPPRKRGRALRPLIETMEPRWMPAPVLSGLVAGAEVQPAALAATTTTLTSAPDPANPPTSITFTVTVAGPSGGTTAPTGTVSLSGITGLQPATLTPGVGPNAGTSTATFVVSTNPFIAAGQTPPVTLAPGQYSVQATYAGDANDATSTSTALTQTVAKIPTGLGFLLSTPNPSLLGQPVTFAVVAAPGITNINETGPTPTGSINLFDNGVAVGMGALTPSPQPAVGGINSTVSFTLQNLPAGINTITATYPGDANYAATGPTALVLHVEAASTTTVAIAPNPAALGQPAIVAVTVKGPTGAGVPTGLVTYVASSSDLNGGNNTGVTLSGFAPLDPTGRAVIGLLPPTTGSYVLTVNYLGDNSFLSSFSTIMTLRVLLPTRTTLAAAPSPSTAGHAVTFTATVGGITGGLPPGTVTFRDGTKVLGTATLNTAGHATLTTAALTAGRHAITATYNGSSQFATSGSAALSQLVNSATPVVVDGPRITRVQRFGLHTQPSTIVLTFNAPLNVFTAQNVANYLLTGPSPATRPFRILSAVYNATTHTVTLHPAQRLDIHPRFRYTLLVNGSAAGGVTGTSGRLLDGAGTGKPGSNYVTILSGP